MQIAKSHYMLGSIQKQYLEHFALLNLRHLELFTREVCIFKKSRLLFNMFHCFTIKANTNWAKIF